MRLAELGPYFVRIRRKRSGEFVTSPRTHYRVASIKKADGIFFLCPKCFAENGGPVGTHGFLLWQPHVGRDYDPSGGRWSFVGTGLEDLSLVAGSSSVLAKVGCQAHFFVENGNIRMC